MEEQQLTKKQRRELKKQERREREAAARQKQKQKSLAIWIIVLVGLALIVWGMIQAGSKSGNQGEVVTHDNEQSLQVAPSSQVKGNPEAEVVLVEFSDFQCPACASYYPIVSQLAESYGDRLAVVYKHYPLQQIHPNAELAARAAEAAGKQDKFWDMHDQLFAAQTSWSNVTNRAAEGEFVKYAGQLGLDVEQFQADLENDEIEDLVDQHQFEGNRLGVSGTPTFFLNGTQLTNPPGYEAFAALIEEQLANFDTGEVMEEATLEETSEQSDESTNTTESQMGATHMDQ